MTTIKPPRWLARIYRRFRPLPVPPRERDVEYQVMLEGGPCNGHQTVSRTYGTPSRQIVFPVLIEGSLPVGWHTAESVAEHIRRNWSQAIYELVPPVLTYRYVEPKAEEDTAESPPIGDSLQ